MKKKLIFTGVAMLLTAAAVTGFSAYNKTDASDLLNANVEALTAGESGNYPWQTMARCNGWDIVWACTSIQNADRCSRYVCNVDF